MSCAAGINLIRLGAAHNGKDAWRCALIIRSYNQSPVVRTFESYTRTTSTSELGARGSSVSIVTCAITLPSCDNSKPLSNVTTAP
eukprot:4057189-Amphidinium_carterae.1